MSRRFPFVRSGLCGALAALVCTCTPEAKNVVTGTTTLDQVFITPSVVTLATDSTQQFSVSGVMSDGSVVAPAVNFTASGGVVSSTGFYTAGSTPGTYRVIATTVGGILADTSNVTITPPPPTLTQLTLTPNVASVQAGGTQQFQTVGQMSDGSVSTVAVTYSATGGTISSGGLYTAGPTTGGFRVIAQTTVGTTLFADTSLVTITAGPPPPPTLTSIILTPPSATVSTGATQQFSVVGHMSDGSSSLVAVNYSATGGTITAGGLYTAGGTPGNFRVIAVQQGGTLADTAAVTVTSGTTNGTTLLTENFEDTNFGGRGWYDQTTLPTSTTEHTTGSTRSMMWHWAAGTVNPLAAAAARHKVTPTNTIYISYWVKFSTNFVGSGETFHPHEFTMLTTESPDFAGLAHTPLTLLLETTWQGSNGVPRMEGADGANVNLTQGAVPNDLTAVTENRAACGCNGNPDGFNVACFNSGGGVWDNTKLVDAASAQFLSAPGAQYKNDWHHVEAYFQLNSISGGIGQLDGIMQYWYDGNLVIDEHGVQFRTGAHPTMQINQFVISPYIGDGSPVDQTEWIDDLLVRTAKP